jgi:hypothetical protein
MVDACDSSGSSIGVRSSDANCSGSSTASASIGSASTTCSRDGKANPSSSIETGARRRLLRPAARGGKGASGTDSQGSGG